MVFKFPLVKRSADRFKFWVTLDDPWLGIELTITLSIQEQIVGVIIFYFQAEYLTESFTGWGSSHFSCKIQGLNLGEAPHVGLRLQKQSDKDAHGCLMSTAVVLSETFVMESESHSLQLSSSSAQGSHQFPEPGEITSGLTHPIGQVTFWCYLCSKVVLGESVRPGNHSEMACSDCGSGFIEALTAAESLPNVRRSQHRRRHRGGGGLAQSMEGLENVYSHQFSQLLQLLGQSSRSNTMSDQEHQSEQESEAGRIIFQDELGFHPSLSRSSSHRRATSEIESEGFDRVESFLGESDTNITFSGNETILGESDTNITFSGLGGNSDASGDVFGEGQNFLDGEMFLVHHDNESHIGGDSESGIETMHEGIYEWDSIDGNDDEEWEEADEEEEDGAEVREGTGETRGGSSAEESSEQAEWRSQLHSWRTRWRNVRRLQRRTMNVELNLRHYLPGIFETLGRHDLEASMEFSERPQFVGNPGDYIDARGFEQLLQHLVENDDARRGAPPAAQSAVENLPLIVILQEHEEDGSSVCAICKDAVSLGGKAKQLPCMHLYHPDCILPWLSARNSCPVCRYELPTDDPDYEVERRNAGSRANHIAAELNSSLESSSELSGYTEEIENVSVEQQLHAEHINEASRMLERPSVADFEEETDTEGVTNDSLAQQVVVGAECDTNLESNNGIRERVADNNRVAASPSLGRGWFLLAAGPVLSVAGFVLVLCFGNHLVRGRIQQNGRRVVRQQQHHFQDAYLQAVGVPNEVSNRRKWWNPFGR